jgi:hypothetical protein
MMLSFLADENFNGHIVRGLLRRAPALDLVRAQDVGLSGVDDIALLDWSAEHRRILLTHDVRTITRHAYARISAGLAMPGVLEIKSTHPAGSAIEEILLIAEYSSPDDWLNQVIFLRSSP